MSKSCMIRQAVNCFLNDTRGSPKILGDLLEELKTNKELLQSNFDRMEQSINEAMKEEIIERPKPIIYPKEDDRMIREVRIPTTRPPQDIEPQMYKPSLDEVLAYIKAQKKCTNLEIAKHFNAQPTYIKMVVPTDHPELTVRSSEGVMTYCTGDAQ